MKSISQVVLSNLEEKKNKNVINHDANEVFFVFPKPLIELFGSLFYKLEAELEAETECLWSSHMSREDKCGAAAGLSPGWSKQCSFWNYKRAIVTDHVLGGAIKTSKDYFFSHFWHVHLQPRDVVWWRGEKEFVRLKSVAFVLRISFKHLLLLLLRVVPAGLLRLRRGDRLLPGSVLLGCCAAAAREYRALIRPPLLSLLPVLEASDSVKQCRRLFGLSADISIRGTLLECRLRQIVCVGSWFKIHEKGMKSTRCSVTSCGALNWFRSWVLCL